MAKDGVLFSIIIPSFGKRPKALKQAIASVERAGRFAGLGREQIEVLIGFGGTRGESPRCAYPLYSYQLPRDRESGNGIRRLLVRMARGEKLIFLDDDNILKPQALRVYLKFFETELVAGRIDTQLALRSPNLPAKGRESIFQQGNILLLNLCVSRRLVVDKCGGWRFDVDGNIVWENIRRWQQLAQSMTILEDIVGVLDAGRSLDLRALSPRQEVLLDQLACARGAAPFVMKASQTPVLCSGRL